MFWTTLARVSAGGAVAATTVFAGDASLAPSSHDEERDEAVLSLSPFSVESSLGGYLGATPGGLQDVNFGRNLLEWGMLPRPGEISAEGLFSEFDLPTPDAEKSRQLLSITGDAKAASILGQPAITHLAQIGFSSGLEAQSWQRDPVFLVVVADVSGSMGGNLPLLKESIATMLDHLGSRDAFALVSFATDVNLDHAPRLVSPEAAAGMSAAIDALRIRGGTDIETGLQLGFSVARTQVTEFSGRTRVVLITDAMPNIGATTPGSFMALAEDASLAGIGLTTIGVGLRFSADFVKRVSSVSGGNAFYFADAGQMRARLADDFDFMVTELAFDIEIRLEPAVGCRFVEVYGLPGDVFVRTPAGGLLLDLKTLFLSRERGALFISIAADRPALDGTTLGHASLSYSLFGSATPVRSSFNVMVRPERQAGRGLCRGEMLINEYEVLRSAGAAFYDGGSLTAATAQARALANLFAEESDRELAQEAELLENLATFLELAGQDPEIGSRALRARPDVSPLVGVWRFAQENRPGMSAPSDYLIFLPGGQAGFLDENHDSMRVVNWKGRHLGNGRENGVTLAVDDGRLVYRSVNGKTRERVSWQLERCAATEPWQPRVLRPVDHETGYYRARETLAGVRTQVSLQDLPAAVTQVTTELLAGVGVGPDAGGNSDRDPAPRE